MSTTYVSTAAADLILLDDPVATTATRSTRTGIVSALVGALIIIASALSPQAHTVPLVGGSGLTPNASALAQYVASNYPGVQSIGGVRPDPLPDHPSGRAIDIMVNDMALGDTIAADIQNQSDRFSVSYILWRVANHFNHIHVTVN
jgi:hypothetical protein